MDTFRFLPMDCVEPHNPNSRTCMTSGCTPIRTTPVITAGAAPAIRPLFWVDPLTGQETLVAVVSRGSLTSSHDYRVDTAEALDFLNQVIESVNDGDL